MGHFSWRAPPNLATGTLPAAGLRRQEAGGGSSDRGGTAAAAAAPPAGASPGWVNGAAWPRSGGGAAPGQPSGLDFGNGGPSLAVRPACDGQACTSCCHAGSRSAHSVAEPMLWSFFKL